MKKQILSYLPLAILSIAVSVCSVIVIVDFSCKEKSKPTVDLSDRPLTDSCVEKQLPAQAVARKKKPHTTPSPNPTPGQQQPVVNYIYLSFDGGTVSGTSWNASGDIQYAPSGLNTFQKDSIILRMQKKLDSIKVEIGTDYTKFKSLPSTSTQMIIFSPTHGWFGNGAAGTSFIGSFGSGEPAWVFTDLLNYKAYRIKEVGLHETAHTLGCQHDVKWDSTCTNYKLSSFRILGYIYNAYENDWGEAPTPDGCNTKQNALATMAATAGWKY